MNRRNVLKVLAVLGILAALPGCNDSDDPAPRTYPQTIVDGRAAIQQRLIDTDTPSASVALIDGERIVWSETFGFIDKAASTVPDATTMYGIGSVSKVFAAIAVMKLVDQGLIDLDAPLTRYLPDFRMASPEYSQITVRMLLNHSAGLGGTDYRNAFTYAPILDYAAQVQQALATQRLKHLPGEMAVYCNDCLTMTELLVATISGRPYPQFVQDEILQPLGMTHSRFALAPFPAGSFAPGYTGDRTDSQEYTNGYATGGLYSTPGDMARLAMMFMNGGQYGGVRILSAAAVAEMGRDQTQQLPFNPIPTMRWGLGWDGVAQPGLATVGITAWHKNGGTLTYASDFFVAPDQRLAVMVTGAAIQFNPGGLAEQIMLNALAERGSIPAVPTPLPETSLPEQLATDADLAAIVGDYAHYAALMRIAAAPDRTLQISTYSNGVWAETASGLKRRVDGTFSSDAQPLRSYWALVADGRRYLAARAPGGMGHYLSEIPFGQQVSPTAPLTDVWQRRAGQHWLAVNEDAQSIPLIRGLPPRLTLEALESLPGYLFATSALLETSQIVDPSGSETVARMFLKIPVNFGRDMNDVVIETRNDEEWVCYGSTLHRPQASVPRLAAGDSVVTIDSEGYAEWRQLPVAGSVTISGASAWKWYDADLKLLTAGAGPGSASAVPAGAYVMLYGPPNATITLAVME
ncbi:MAG TPA: serine hydrolase domain-containing protein [Candidatus Competibacteraceae bacterium]|nr:serine hydrolase domain-containing protein [Candidatus Competibacteraceae bacterium]HRZ06568.1 serine hydrolase domain-containing protein [Candidatus Competibacteraceae bacterium]HSA47061.1 serine hydrolase domain-containing protein [Candidatus Competibacteraceae bacterium]